MDSNRLAQETASQSQFTLFIMAWSDVSILILKLKQVNTLLFYRLILFELSGIISFILISLF